jgi:two-component system, response regulator
MTPERRTILLVEDNPDDEELTRRALRKQNIANDIVVAHDGVEALAFLHEQPGNQLPQLVLLDLNLPRIDGLEVLRRIRAHERTRTLPVVVLTSSKEDEDVLQSYSLGANAYVRKPVDFANFADAVKALGLFWLVLNQTAPRTSG